MKEIFVRSVLNKHRKRDEWFLDDYSLNPYKLCSFNCIYCYIRGSKYGKNMRRELAVKVNAPMLLKRELARLSRRGMHGFIALSSATEPWMDVEEKYRVTRRCLEVILRHRFPVHCLTKSTLISRDLDLLKEIDERAILPRDLKGKLSHGVLITFSMSTLNEEVSRIFEPNAPRPTERLRTLQKVKEEGFFAGIAYIPVLPFISDSLNQLEGMIKTAKEYEADYVFVGALTLYGKGKELYYRVIENYFPELLSKYKQLYKSLSQPNKSYQRRLEIVVSKLCEKYGVKHRIV